MTSNITRAVAGLGAAAMLAVSTPTLAADPTDAMLYIAGELTAQYDLPAGLIPAVCETESDFDPGCRTGSCVGLMQIHSAYAAAFARATGMESYSLTDPEDNMRIGACLLADYLDRYEGDIHMALMCYNLGEAGALRKLASGIDQTSYSRKVVSRIEKWSVAGVPETDGRAQPPEAAANSPASAPQVDIPDASCPPENAEEGSETSQAVRAAVTGVWQRVREVLFR